MRVLLVEDDAATAQLTELMLRGAGFNVYTTDLGEEAIDLAKLYDYDAITLDSHLADMSGLDVVTSLRKAKVHTPVLVLGPDAVDEKVRLLNAGADDVQPKPFHKDEVVARLMSLIRRSAGEPSSSIEVGAIRVELTQKRAFVNGNAVHLTGKEYSILELLALRKGQTLTKEMFLNHLYGGMDEPEIKIVDVFVCKLRRKLREAGADNHIGTIWGRGYRMSDETVEATELPIVTSKSPDPLDSIEGKILRTLAEGGDATIRQLRFPVGKSIGYISITLAALRTAGRVGSRLTGQGRELIFGILPPGERWLAHHGYERPSDTKAAA